MNRAAFGGGGGRMHSLSMMVENGMVGIVVVFSIVVKIFRKQGDIAYKGRQNIADIETGNPRFTYSGTLLYVI
ncbi:hypothetical protein BIFGAL_04135 [Bifidobacterium gallicum DSM 20093 = LMG 11596]|uniref:Uncharacterized protein n=1 Tax=Bifidobacterium gallicum DSM 20093 = LMG 11596 TaxID=561180 RepID=D1NW87_9BIFI|nr:hypothetical protein BIFGAL_04135 [Bifidobacterium gallicum DSM 20093 = LMG 11596]